MDVYRYLCKSIISIWSQLPEEDEQFAPNNTSTSSMMMFSKLFAASAHAQSMSIILVISFRRWSYSGLLNRFLYFFLGHILSRMKRSNILFGHPTEQRFNIQHTPDYAKEFSLTNRARTASLPEKNKALYHNCERKCLICFPMNDLSRHL
jgi:hypothetical protein